MASAGEGSKPGWDIWDKRRLDASCSHKPSRSDHTRLNILHLINYMYLLHNITFDRRVKEYRILRVRCFSGVAQPGGSSFGPRFKNLSKFGALSQQDMSSPVVHEHTQQQTKKAKVGVEGGETEVATA